MSPPLFIPAVKFDELKAAIAAARAQPISWEILRQRIPAHNEETDTLRIEDRPPDTPQRPASQTVVLPQGWMVCISLEEQPAGLLLHLSISDPRDKAPGPNALAGIMMAAGITAQPVRVWIEEFLVDGGLGGTALNALFMDKERDAMGVMGRA